MNKMSFELRLNNVLFSICLAFMVLFNIFFTVSFINTYRDYMDDYRTINDIAMSYNDSKSLFLQYTREHKDSIKRELERTNAGILEMINRVGDSVKQDRDSVMMYRIVSQMLEHRQEVIQNYIQYGRESINDIDNLNFQIERNLNLLTTDYLNFISNRFEEYSARMKMIILIGNCVLVILTFVVFMNNSKMYQKVSNKLLENEVQKRHLAEAQVRELQMQINPHFLFNTLSLIIRSIQMGDSNTSIQLIRSTSQILRRSIETKQSLISLDEEIELLERYLYIQRIHVRGRIKIEMDIRKAYTDNEVLIPPLILQPLVENAILHGLVDVVKDGIIRIEIVEEPSHIRICIEDNGCGISKEIIDNLKNHVSMKSIGLSNVWERLQLIYHSEDVINIETSEAGTTVTIKIPKDTKADRQK